MTGDDAILGEQSLQEVEYVDECPSCDAQLIGMSPDELREEHSKECTPILQLVVFPDE